MVLTRIAAALVVVAALAGCSHGPEPVTDETLTAELQQADAMPASGLAAWKSVFPKTTCDDSKEAFDLLLTMRGITAQQLRSMRVAAVHFCPERVSAIDAVLDLTR
jgi:hypothetical protein